MREEDAEKIEELVETKAILTKQLKEKSSALSKMNEIKLPLILNIDAIRIYENKGKDFLAIESFVKETVVHAFATSTSFMNEVAKKIYSAVKAKVAKMMDVIIIERERFSNTCYVDLVSSAIKLHVKGLVVLIFTLDSQEGNTKMTE